MDKRELRHEVALRRAALSQEEWLAGSGRICERIEALTVYLQSDGAYAYMALPGEVLLDPLLEDAWRQGKRVCIPRVEGAQMRFFEITSLSDVTVGYQGIREPEGSKSVRGRSPLFLMPSVALDGQMRRIGHGGGFYDRYLESNPMPVKVAPAFDFQVYARVPADSWDIRVDAVVTEERILGQL